MNSNKFTQQTSFIAVFFRVRLFSEHFSSPYPAGRYAYEILGFYEAYWNGEGIAQEIW